MNLKKNLPLKIPLSTLPDVKLTPQINKVIYGDRVLLDLTNDTVTESSVLKGVTFHKSTGEERTGSFDLSLATITADTLLEGYTAYNSKGELIVGTYKPLDISLVTATAESIINGYKAYNANGELVTGTYIPKYYALDFIQSTGTQYINTGLTSSTIGGLEVACTRTGTLDYGRVFGSSSSKNFEVLVAGTTYTSYSIYINGSSANYTVNSDTENIIKFYGGNWYINGVSQGTYSTLSSDSNNLWIGRGNDRYSNFKYRYFKIYDKSSNLVRDFVPAQKTEDSSIGLYDKANNKFYSNAGSSTFTAGSIVGFL